MKDFRSSTIYYYNETILWQEGYNLPAIFLPKRRDAKTRTGNKHTMKGVSKMKGLEIAVIIISCGMKLLEIMDED